MKQTKKVFIPLALIAVLALGTSAMAWKGYSGGQNCQATLSQLTPEKQEAANKIFDKYNDKLQTLSQDLWAKHTEMQALIEAGKLEKEEIESYVKEMREIKDKLYKKQNEMRTELEKATGLDLTNCNFRGGMGGKGRGNCGGAPSGGCPGYNPPPAK